MRWLFRITLRSAASASDGFELTNEREYECDDSTNKQPRTSSKNPDNFTFLKVRCPHTKKKDSSDDSSNTRPRSQHSKNPSDHSDNDWFPDTKGDQANEDDRSNDRHHDCETHGPDFPLPAWLTQHV
jgi:hypothetical protein